MPNVTMSPEVKELAEKVHANIEKGKEWYKKLAKELERKYFGHYIVINTETGEYVVDADDVKVLDLSDEKFPNRKRYFTRIGLPNPFGRFYGG